MTPEYAAIVASPEARAYVLGQLKAAAKAAGLLSFEVPKAVFLEPAPFDVERDLITPTFKLKRPNLLAHFKKQARNSVCAPPSAAINMPARGRTAASFSTRLTSCR